MSKRRRYLSESESESEPAAEEANGGESEEADEPYSTIWRAAGPLTMRQDMQHDSQVLYSLRTLLKQIDGFRDSTLKYTKTDTYLPL